MLATQCLLQRKPKTYAINVEGALARGVTAKDLILVDHRTRSACRAARASVFEYRGGDDPWSVDGRADDGVQHVDRGRRAGPA